MAFAPFLKITPKKAEAESFGHTRGIFCAVDDCPLPGGLLSGSFWYCRHHHSSASFNNQRILLNIKSHLWIVDLFERLIYPERFYKADGITAEIVEAKNDVLNRIKSSSDIALNEIIEKDFRNTRVLAYRLIREFDKRVYQGLVQNNG